MPDHLIRIYLCRMERVRAIVELLYNKKRIQDSDSVSSEAYEVEALYTREQDRPTTLEHSP